MYASSIGDSIAIETLRFYISNVQLFKNDALVYALPQKHLLIDMEVPESMQIHLPEQAELRYDKIKFNIGVDSVTSVSGAFGGDLDPTNGMYWTWQSGYINFKLEGKTPLCPARKHQFQYHIGGYQPPYNTLQTVELVVSNSKKIRLEMALDQLLTQVNVSENFQVMSPNQQAVDMAEVIATIFTITE